MWIRCLRHRCAEKSAISNIGQSVGGCCSDERRTSGARGVEHADRAVGESGRGQRVLISRLHAQGKPTATAEQVLTQIESNLRLMHKIHQFIKVGKPLSLQG